MRQVLTISVLFAYTLLSAVVFAEDLRPISRNSLFFVESTQEGEEWVAYRVADERHPVIYRVDGPGRVLLKLRTYAEGSDPAVAAILNDQRVVLTARVEPEPDKNAKFVDAKKDAKPAKIRLYLVRVGKGRHRVTIRYSGGGAMLVSTRFSQAVVSEWDENADDVPLVPIRNPESGSVQRIGTLRADDADLLGDVKEDTTTKVDTTKRQGIDWSREETKRGITEPAPRKGPVLDEPERPAQPQGSADIVRRELTVRVPYFQYEIRGGLHVTRLALNPAPVIGMDARIPVPGLDSRVWTMGLSLDAAHTTGESSVKNAVGAPIDIAEIRHSSVIGSLDVRWTLREADEVLDPYLGVGVGGMFGVMTSETDSRELESNTRGMLGSLRFGAAYGKKASRPFVELRLLGGFISSDLTRNGQDSDVGDPVGYAAVSVLLGYRVELLTDAPLED